ncbi:MAG: FtsQ-type POTRA domain-containing protein, partial [Rhodospirillales bacterium]|nr:FtsQ-type POTRA domain-containing protein [Rhodospirillales bacterium]
MGRLMGKADKGSAPRTTRTPKRRPRVKPLWRTPQLIAIGILAVVTVTGFGGWWIWNEGFIQRSLERAKWTAIGITAKTGFTVSEIFVEGRHRTSPEALRKALRLERGAPILAFDPDAARIRVEALPWVRQAAVERQLPNVVQVKIAERRPLALWQRDGVFSLVDSDGVIIPVGALEAFKNLIVIVGGDAPRHAGALMDVIAQSPGLAGHVKAAVRVSGRRWDLHLLDGVVVRLPEEDPGGAWRRLGDFERDSGLLRGSVYRKDHSYTGR